MNAEKKGKSVNGSPAKKSFYVDKYDNDGFLIENNGVVMEVE